MKKEPALLIVEDEIDLQELLKEILSAEFKNILCASNGVEAFGMLKANQDICAIISDINMPKMTGLELLKLIRSEYNPVPFVILTGYGDPSSMRQAVQLNATDFLDKPINSEELIRVVKRAMEYGKQLAAIEQDIDKLYKDSKAENIDFLKRVKRTTLAMRAESSVYLKKKAS